MSLLVEHRRNHWRAVGLLAAAAALSACAVTTQVPIAPTETSPAPAPIEMRPLSASEKTALAKALAQTVPNPAAAQFKWLPIPAHGSGAIGYCGLINVKSKAGQYVGFRRFFALVSKGPKGDYAKGKIEHIDDFPVDTAGSNTTGGATPDASLTDANCKEWGYTDFSGAT
jgi:hypothetical protein